MALTGKQNRHLRGLAHHLNPVVIVGDKGITAEVVQATIEALEHHELIKVRIAGADSGDVREAAEDLKAGTKAEIAQIIGKIVVLYRARKKKPEIKLPKA